KVYGLAGLRVGVAVASEKTISKLDSIAHPYPLNTFSLNVSNYLLNQTERLEEFIELNRTLAKKLLHIFKEEVGDVVSIIDSSTNFV
ncbi:aminotransferase class I/II-fold pyridoxal phosphate-dependent enzyme, partial [Bacillus cereus group sp. Bce020]|uniref:aminotransferase class I/II-fold pyridoxal phosphate-dependent enzyme n=1 Tax=Bacillus cereus group sp. Bce020 TaxID=3445246 RepID=UPI003F2565CF